MSVELISVLIAVLAIGSIPAGVERAAVGHNNPAWIKPKAWRASRS